MRRIAGIIGLITAVVVRATAAIGLSASGVTVENMTVDKPNYYVVVDASVSKSEYKVAFDVWPKNGSLVGSFSAEEGTILYVNSYVNKVRYDGKPVNTMYFCEETSQIALSIVDNGDSTCTLSGQIDAYAQDGTRYTYTIAPYVFAYIADSPDSGEDAYRFEPAEPQTISFEADVVDIRFREKGLINITLNEMAHETYDWVELNLRSDSDRIAAGNYTISADSEPLTLTASRGYLGVQNDDPCYIAIRGNLEDWGSYTPYYLVEGSLAVAYNEKGDTISISGDVRSKHGSNIHIEARSYNMLYTPEDKPREPEQVALTIDTVVVTYMREESAAGRHRYTMNFFSRSADAYPQVLMDVLLSDSMQLVAGRYTLQDSALSGVTLFQNQSDFNEWFFGGEPYVIDTVELTLSAAGNGRWTYDCRLTDTIGSVYTFSLTQAPHIINYPTTGDDLDPKDEPYKDELRETETLSLVFDSIRYYDATVERDGIVDIYLYQTTTDQSGLSYVAQLGFYTEPAVSDKYLTDATYPINGSEDINTFSASMGRYGNVLIPCYIAEMDVNGWAHKIWYIVGGEIRVAGESLVANCRSYWGSTIHFAYPTDAPEGLVSPADKDHSAKKLLRGGQLIIRSREREYNALGEEIR